MLLLTQLIGFGGTTEASAPTGFSCNLTVASIAGGAAFGFARTGNINGLPAAGSIDGEPLPGSELDSLYWASGGGPGAVYFFGDNTTLMGQLTGKTLWIDGVDYGDGGGWTAAGGSDEWTGVEFPSGLPNLTSGSHLIEFK